MKVLVVLISIAAFAISATHPMQNDGVRTKHYNHSKGIAIQGYDPVSYFVNKVRKGDKKYSYTHKGITYYFATEPNLNVFKKNPERYEPQYGGWCAYAMGNDGTKVEIDPETYKVVGGKLYLFYNKFFNNTKKDWDKDEINLMAKADKNWAAIISK